MLTAQWKGKKKRLISLRPFILPLLVSIDCFHTDGELDIGCIFDLPESFDRQLFQGIKTIKLCSTTFKNHKRRKWYDKENQAIFRSTVVIPKLKFARHCSVIRKKTLVYDRCFQVPKEFVMSSWQCDSNDHTNKYNESTFPTQNLHISLETRYVGAALFIPFAHTAVPKCKEGEELMKMPLCFT